MKKLFKILIVEDELMIAEMLREMLMELGYSVVATAKNYKEAVQHLENGPDLDLVILDINLSDEKNGLDLGQLIKEDFQKPFIYLTSYSDPKTINQAASTEPAAYILKPFTKGDLHATIEVIKARQKPSGQSVTIRDHDMTVKIQIDDVLYVKSDNIYLEIYTESKKYIHRSSLEGLLDEVNHSNLVRTHRSYLVNINRVQAINGQNAIINGTKVPISRKHKEELTELFISKG